LKDLGQLLSCCLSPSIGIDYFSFFSTLTALLDFVHENTSTPFEKPVLGEEDQDDDAGADEFDFEGDEEVVEGSGDGDALESGDELQNLFDEGLHDEL
jgi:hypothetical protein